MELLRQATATCADVKNKTNCNPLPIVGIPYRGGGPLMNAILANEIPLEFINQDAALPYVQAGKLRPIAVSSLQRNPLYPNVPTVAESGYPGFNAPAWWAVLAPGKTPPAIVNAMNQAVTKALKTPAVADKLKAQGIVIVAGNPEVLNNFIGKQIAVWGKFVIENNIKEAAQ